MLFRDRGAAGLPVAGLPPRLVALVAASAVVSGCGACVDGCGGQGLEADLRRNVGVIGGAGEDNAWSLALAPDGRLCLAGHFRGYADLDPGPSVALYLSEGDRDVYVLCREPSGEIAWIRTFGGAGREEWPVVAHAPDGSVLVAGRFDGRVDLDPGEATDKRTSAGSDDVFLVSLDREGESRWAWTFGGRGLEYGPALAVDNDGVALLLFGSMFHFELSPGTRPPGDHRSCEGAPDADVAADAGLREPVPDAEPRPRRNEHRCESSRRVAPSPTRGSTGLDVVAVAVGSDGELIWTSRYGGPGDEIPSAAAAHEEGGFIVVGFATGETISTSGGALAPLRTAGDTDAFVASISPGGEVDWWHTFGAAVTDRATAVATGRRGQVVVTGTFHETLRFDGVESGPDGDRASLSSAGSRDVFVLQLRRDGELEWAQRLGGPGRDQAHGVAIAGDGSVLVVGGVNGRVDLDVGPGEAMWDAGWTWDAFVLSLAHDGEYLWSFAYGAAGKEEGRDVVVGADGRVFVAASEPGGRRGTDRPWEAFMGTEGDRDAVLFELPLRGYWRR